jgi:hypothetical protein
MQHSNQDKRSAPYPNAIKPRPTENKPFNFQQTKDYQD